MDPSSEIVPVATTALAWFSMVTETGIEKSKVTFSLIFAVFSLIWVVI